MAYRHFLLIVFFFAFADNISAQNKNDSIRENRLDEVRISSFHINDSLLNAPASIGIIPEKDLQRNDNADITPAVNRISGVLMQSGSYNTNRISIRGIGARTPYGTNKIRAFYGNIPLTSGDSETTIEDIDVENIEQVEVIKGPLSSLYGAGLGGAILITPKTSGLFGDKAKISSTFGSYNLQKNSIGYSHDQKSYTLNISYHKLSSDGWRENSAYNREGVTLSGALFRKEKSKLTYFGNYTYMKAFIASSIDKNTFDNNPRGAAFTWKSAKGFEKYDSYLSGLAYEFEISKIKNATSIFVNHKESDEPRPFDILKQNTTAYGARTQFSGYFDSKRKNSFIIGMEYFRDNYKGRNFENLYEDNNGLGSLQGNQIAEAYQNRIFYNVFAQFRSLLSRQFEIQAGININKTKFDLENTLPAETKQGYSYDAIVSPQLSLLYKPGNSQTIYASVSRGFSTPAIEETLNADGTINPDIKPENGYNIEVGGKFYFLNKKLYTEIALYRMAINDLLVAQRVGDDQYIGVNAGKTLHQGVEFSVNYNAAINHFLSINPYLSASIGDYTFKEFINNDIDYSGNELTGVPKNKVNAGLIFNTDFGAYLSADFMFTDKMPINDSNSVYNESYRIWNAKLGWKFKFLKRFSSNIAAGINNIFDEHYASMVLVNATAFGNATPRFYYPGLPVNYYMNVAFAYAF
ncbi:TonB-dependent receptor [Flavobacterium sp. 3HN19-14]|uniref:TonB-dependent receptor n=1 Tax=Flavobacterium sp. 3HN19-14 TaxID=3448133 RepID=UPI003EDF13CE